MASPGEALRRYLEARRTRCVHLLTKRAFCGRPDAAEPENDVPTAVWWCARTAEALGPDGRTAEPRTCDAPGRPCHEPPRRPGA